MCDSVPPFPGPLTAERSPLRTPDDVARMLQLHALGWGVKRIARELGCAKNTVKKYVTQGAWRPPAPPARVGVLDALQPWLAACFHQHHGNADVVRQALQREHAITVSLRTVERAVAPFRQALRAAARATVRFETPPGEQLQIDFGERTVEIAGIKERVHLFVATLGYSRRVHVRLFSHARQSAWLEGLESTFAAFGGVPATVLLDNAKALVLRHVVATREVTFHPRLLAFAQYWGFRPIACAPYRAQTKGKDERGVGYVKHNALAGHTFASFAALEAHVAQWTREVADVRVHGTTGETPLQRFTRDEATALSPLAARTSFQPMREWQRRVQVDCTIELHRNWYSVPWRYLGETVRVAQQGERVTVHYGGATIADHRVAVGPRVRRVDPAHLEGITARRVVTSGAGPTRPEASLLRPLAEYAAAVGERACGAAA
jgi:transposase